MASIRLLREAILKEEGVQLPLEVREVTFTKHVINAPYTNKSKFKSCMIFSHFWIWKNLWCNYCNNMFTWYQYITLQHDNVGFSPEVEPNP